MEALSNIPCSVIQTADILAWDLVKTMLCKSLNPILEHAGHWLGHIEDHVINQLEVDRCALLMNWKLIEGFINNVVKVTQARVAIELQEPMLVLMASSISLVKLKGVRGILFDCINSKSLDVLEHVSGRRSPLPRISSKSLVDKLGNHDHILHIKLLDTIFEAAHDVAIVREDVHNLIGGVVASFNLATGVVDSESICNSKLEFQGSSSQGQILGKVHACSAIYFHESCHFFGNVFIRATSQKPKIDL